MHHTFSDINKTINLQQPINNKCANKRIGLKSFTYTMGWYNLVEEYFQIGEIPTKITNGYYSFQQIANIFRFKNISLTVNETNGIASLITPNELKISKGLRLVLGFGRNKRKFAENKTHYGERPVDFAIYKNLYVHLLQLNTSNNYFNGSPSTILSTVPVENKNFGDIVSVRFEHPEYKQLAHGDISELSIIVCDENGQNIDNNKLPINCVLEII